jgi:hypothetical protein
MPNLWKRTGLIGSPFSRSDPSDSVGATMLM